MDFEQSLKKILADYADDISGNVAEIVKKTANKAKASLKSTSPVSTGQPSMGKKHYKDQWAVRQEIERFSAKAIIYQKSPTYTIAHLLENGHAKRGGGRVGAIPHIKPTEEMVIKTVESEIRRAISG